MLSNNTPLCLQNPSSSSLSDVYGRGDTPPLPSNEMATPSHDSLVPGSYNPASGNQVGIVKPTARLLPAQFGSHSAFLWECFSLYTFFYFA